MKKIFSSRKFTTAILGALLVGLNDGLNLGLRHETVQHIVLILASWVVGESAVDAASAWSNGRNGDRKSDTHSPSTPA